MKTKVFLILLAGLSSMVVLYFFPPWKAHGSFAGHIRIDRSWLEFDFRRFYIEQGLIVVITLVLAWRVWWKDRMKRKGS
jgi:hypothetical protein